MTYEERLKKLLENNDPFWYTTIDNFVKATYDDKEQGISDLENLAKDSAKFNEFTKQIIQRRNDLKSVKDDFFKKENIDVEEISKKLVLDTQNLEDNAEVSISTLLNKKLDTKTEKCLCGNTFELIWDENQKFQMVRCPQCNNEIKFKNPKLLINEEENSLAHELYKKNDDDKIWWVDNRDKVGEHVFTFDKKKYYNLFKDYPHNLTPEEQVIFDKENPYWANFFADRK